MAAQNSSSVNLADDISKMKVVEIKKELKNRGLSTAGTKSELIQRLQLANSQPAQDSILEDGNADVEMLDEDEVLAGVDEGGDFDDDDLASDVVLAEEPKVTAPASTTLAAKQPTHLAADNPQDVQRKKRVLVRRTSVNTSPAENENIPQEKSLAVEADKEKTEEANGKKVVKLSAVSVKERLELRAQKFGAPLSEAAKKEARAARFGISPSVKMPEITASTKITILKGPSDDILKKRAERFGGNVSRFALKAEESEKLKKRQERFGISAATVDSLEEKKKLRAKRFKM